MSRLPQGYRIDTVMGRLTQPVAAEIVRFWMQQGVIPSIEEARRRASQVVAIVRNDQDEIVALNSVYPAAYRSPQENYFFYRLFVRPQDRKIGVNTAATRHAVDFLKQQSFPKLNIKGVVIITENPKLAGEGARRSLKRLGFDYDGRGPKGYDIWRVDFADASPSQPPPQVGEEQNREPQVGEEQNQ